MNSSRPILIADDDVGMREGLSRSLRREGYVVTLASDGEEALHQLQDRAFRMVITDLEMPGLKGLDVLKQVKKRTPAVPVVVITAYGSIGTAVEAMKEGAFDFLAKPFSNDALRDVVQRACSQPLPAAAGAPAPPGAAGRSETKRLVCGSPALAEILDLARAVAPSKASVLIQGESGTGKELLARYIHQHSRRAQRPFVAFNCAAIPETLLESELFGHERGAFTGAVQRKAGRFEQADGGTLVLDEI
ncbi:MAG: sigma-54-dependent transcriptional regulator, partial [Nitrospinota bacterium]